MATVISIPLIESISGRTDKDSHTYLRTNKRTGRTVAVRRPPHNSVPPTDRQRERCAIFAAQSRAASQWLKANRPTATMPSGTEEYRQLLHLFSQQTQYPSPYVLLRSLIDDNCEVHFPQQNQ